MGALHEGHLSLIDAAVEGADTVIVSVFVNPTQFGPSEDFEEYPRDLERDLELLSGRGAGTLFVPTVSEMYPTDQTIWVEPGSLGERLCGPRRPGHFRGVLTVVAKLFAIVQPDLAVFGQKDFQQSVLIRGMVEQLCLPIRILVAPTVREPDGLALSSRNIYLSADEREVALSLSETLRMVRERFQAGERDRATLESFVQGELESAGAEVEYAEIVDLDRLESPDVASPEDVCAIAARVGTTRLIDNESLGGTSSLDERGDPGPAGR